MDKGFANAEANLEKLAIMVASGFADTARKSDFDRLEKKVGTLENTMTIEMSRLDTRLAQMAPKFEVKDLNRRIGKIEKSL